MQPLSVTARASWRGHRVGWWVGGAAVAAAALGVGTWVWIPPTVVVTSLQTRDLVRTFVLAGRVRPSSTAELGASVAGTIRSVSVREGDRVEVGQVLVTLDDREARARLVEAEAALAEAVAASGSAVEIARVEAAQAERDLERTRAVFAEGARSRQQVEQAEQRWLEARARLDASLAAAAGVDDTVPASVARARAAVEASRARLALTRIVAPADGVVLGRSAEPGDAVQPGQPLLEVAHDGPFEVVVFPAEEDIGVLEVGAPAVASADAYPDDEFAAEISLILPAVDPDQGTVEVRLSIPDQPRYLRPFMTVSVNVEADRSPRADVLPIEAVRALGTDGPWVAVVQGGRIAHRPIDVGLVGERWIEVLSGVDAADPVVTSEDPPDAGARVRARRNEG